MIIFVSIYTYLENENPIINAKQLWHPNLIIHICNDILIGKKNQEKYANDHSPYVAGGKSDL